MAGDVGAHAAALDVPGRLTPTADGARTTLAGQPVVLSDGWNGTYGIVINGSTWAHLR